MRSPDRLSEMSAAWRAAGQNFYYYFEENNMGRSSVLLIYTGGTIGMKTDPSTGALVPFDFNGIYDEFPSLRRLDVDLDVLPFDPIDSSNVEPGLWIRLAEIVRDNYSRYDGFVVLHGTDTMSYSSSALSFMLQNLGKPVVFTGSQIPIGVLRTDGRENLITAIEIAAAKEDGDAIVPEVSLYFQNRLFRANRTKKYSAEELSAFASFNYPALADVGVGIHYRYGAIARAEGGEFEINTCISRDVAVVRIFPGMTEPLLRAMLSADGLKGAVLETYGAGNAPTMDWFIEVLSEAIVRGVHIINVTQCVSGSVNMDIYETGRRLQDIGVISGRDITTEAALTKMMYLLGQHMEPGRFVNSMRNPIRGEMSNE